ncbi:MAG: hypothetical protein ACI8PZ_001224 [Myxococcota bacterium]|jgi:hypothetical protein
MRVFVLASVAVSVQLCAPAHEPADAVDAVLGEVGAAEAIRAQDAAHEVFQQTVIDVFARPGSYRWVWTAPADDNPVLAMLEVLESRGVPTRVARILAYSAAKPDLVPGFDHPAATVELAGVVVLGDTAVGTVLALPERDLWRVPVEQAGVALGRATAIPCLAALTSPQPEYPLGPLPPVFACRALESWATR